MTLKHWCKYKVLYKTQRSVFKDLNFNSIGSVKLLLLTNADKMRLHPIPYGKWLSLLTKKCFGQVQLATAFHAVPATAPRADGASLLKKVQNATLALLECTNAIRSTWQLTTWHFSEQYNISNLLLTSERNKLFVRMLYFNWGLYCLSLTAASHACITKQRNYESSEGVAIFVT